MNIKDIKGIVKRRKKLKNIVEIKTLGQEVCNAHEITIEQSLDILNGRHKDILSVLGGLKVDSQGKVTYELDNGLVVNIN